MKLFDEMPYLENERMVLREMTAEDAPALARVAKDPKVYVYLPTFLYEQKYEDAHEAIKNMYRECFLTKDSIMLGIFLKEKPGEAADSEGHPGETAGGTRHPGEAAGGAEHLSEMAGIAEIYAYDERKKKASIGIRLAQAYWYRGIAVPAEKLLMDYLKECGIRTVTAHIMVHNEASARTVQKLGFENKFPRLWEDWGREGPVLVDKYVYKFYE